ncbi:MAG: hypothetical protein IJY82_01240 [Oscillospiraceae bacterium]|nr:hypothetical protein [Oscillospiraceae bacterium]
MTSSENARKYWLFSEKIQNDHKTQKENHPIGWFFFWLIFCAQSISPRLTAARLLTARPATAAGGGEREQGLAPRSKFSRANASPENFGHLKRMGRWFESNRGSQKKKDKLKDLSFLFQ